MTVVYRMVAGLLGWFALALQYGLVMAGSIGPSAIPRLINFFSYFTILTNILAALALTLPGLAPQSALAQFFIRPTVRTAITAYIIISRPLSILSCAISRTCKAGISWPT